MTERLSDFLCTLAETSCECGGRISRNVNVKVSGYIIIKTLSNCSNENKFKYG